RTNNSSTVSSDTDGDVGRLYSIGYNLDQYDRFGTVAPSDTSQNNKTDVQDYYSNRPVNTSIIAPDHDEKESRLNSQSEPVDEAALVDIPKDKLKLKSKAQLAKERRQRKRAERRSKKSKSPKI
ncbi:hypothetical protein, partial [Ancylomarina sp.]|uniref:hypothetical protein n=1 Tax=Ancylomarina sp. TaxID=1970196 RepID=UPI003564A99A